MRRVLPLLTALIATAAAPASASDMDHGTAALAPPSEEPLDVALGAGVVPFAPVRLVEALLDVDEDERSVVW